MKDKWEETKNEFGKKRAENRTSTVLRTIQIRMLTGYAVSVHVYAFLSYAWGSGQKWMKRRR
ncbi:hypothetical protein DICVIV_09355 [Dictyocaulus viviparus]|uniref:Uncharacterized protein n=1 Tax=Dictyocaulus viviparus TaxID=29172 RepID=A0A0D8XJ56_DICVI|nr:hypothetical protein DICVIV_09355 [Dictyocaulus viviparus]